MAEVVTECVCGQLSALEPGQQAREILAAQASMLADLTAEQRATYDALLAQRAPCDVPGLATCERCGWLYSAGQRCGNCAAEAARQHLARCSDPFCAACLAQIAANEEASAPTYQVATATGVSRPAFSPSGQLWTWTPRGATDYPSLAEAIAAAEAVPPADGLLVQVCRYPAPDPHTAPCIAQRIGRNAWRHDGRELTSLSELLSAAPQ